MDNYFSISNVLDSAIATLKEVNYNLARVADPSQFNKATSEAINQAIRNGQTAAMYWKAMNPTSHQYHHMEKFPLPFFENMSPYLLNFLTAKGIHIYKNELGGATIKVTYTL